MIATSSPPIEANYSPSQQSPYDHLNLASSVVLMLVTVPAVNALILRYHTDGQMGRAGRSNQLQPIMGDPAGAPPSVELAGNLPSKM